MITLRDIGERAIVRDYLRPRYGRNTTNFGDDVAVVRELTGNGGTVVATTDPCPEPAASLIGVEDPRAFGHLLGTINLSDLAAAGVRPAGMLVSLELPGMTSLEEFLSMLDGLDECCADAGTVVLGGNLKEAPSRRATGFAFGSCEGRPMTRSGAKPGDLVAVFGSLGLSWTRILSDRARLELAADQRWRCEQRLVWPKAQVDLGIALRDIVTPSACTDASDGVAAAVAQIASASGVGVHLDLDKITYDDAVVAVAETLQIEPWRIARSWGDWQLVCAIPPERRGLAMSVADRASCEVQFIGVVAGTLGLTGTLAGSTGRLAAIDSERFAHTESLLEWYPDALVDTPVFEICPR